MTKAKDPVLASNMNNEITKIFTKLTNLKRLQLQAVTYSLESFESKPWADQQSWEKLPVKLEW